MVRPWRLARVLEGALVTLMLIFDVPVFRSSDPAESARLMLYIGSQLVRLRDSEYVPYRQAKAKRKKTQQLRVLQSLPGVGPDRAKRLLERLARCGRALARRPKR